MDIEAKLIGKNDNDKIRFAKFYELFTLQRWNSPQDEYHGSGTRLKKLCLGLGKKGQRDETIKSA